MTSAPCRWAIAATSARSADSVKPLMAKLDGWTRSTAVARPSASAASKSAARVRFVVPTSTSRAPARATISGIRTPPPISTSSPRDTTTDPRRPASPTASSSAAALLVDHERVLGAGERDEVLLRGAEPRPAPAGALVQLQVAVGRGAGDRGEPRGARPRRPAEVRVEDHARRVDDVRRDRAGPGRRGLQAGDHRVRQLLLRQRARRRPRAARAPRPRPARAMRRERRGLGRLHLGAHDREHALDAGRTRPIRLRPFRLLTRAAGPRCRTRASGWARRTSRRPPRPRSAR